jgi:hypothetical protein
MIDEPLAALQAVRDRVIAAIEVRTDLDAVTRASWCDDAKNLYFTLIAARDLLRGDQLEPKTIDHIRMLLGVAFSQAGQLGSELQALGDGGRTLEHELKSAVDSCRNAICSSLPSDGIISTDRSPSRAIERSPENWILPCSQCGATAVVIKRASDDIYVYIGITRQERLDTSEIDRILAWLKAADLASFHAYLAHEAKTDGGLDAYCPKCDAIYCRTHYDVYEEWDQGFYDCSRGTCPKGHSRIIDD